MVVGQTTRSLQTVPRGTEKQQAPGRRAAPFPYTGNPVLPKYHSTLSGVQEDGTNEHCHTLPSTEEANAECRTTLARRCMFLLSDLPS